MRFGIRLRSRGCRNGLFECEETAWDLEDGIAEYSSPGHGDVR